MELISTRTQNKGRGVSGFKPVVKHTVVEATPFRASKTPFAEGKVRGVSGFKPVVKHTVAEATPFRASKTPFAEGKVRGVSGFKPAGLLFLLPGLLGFIVFYIWPFFISLGYAFLDKPVNGSFVGIKNFPTLFGNKAYLKGLANTLRFIGISVPLNMALSLGVAMLIHKMRRHKELFSLIFLIPLVIPSGSMVSFWKSLFAYDGALNGLLNAAGTAKVNWLDSNLALFVMVLIFVWKNLGYNMVLYLSGLAGIPKDYYEAASVDGAKPWQAFWHITLPHLASTSVLVLIMSIINSFKVFKEIYLITGSYPHDSIYTLQHFMNNMFQSLNYPRLTTATTILVVIIALFTQALLKLERKASS